MITGRHFYCNTLFDLQLGGFSTRSLKRTAAEMTALFVPLMQQGDSIHLDADPCGGYESYLFHCGIGPLTHAMHTPGDFLLNDVVVWGQDAAARKRISGSLENMPDFPSCEVVRKINGRKFCWELGRQWGNGVPGSEFCESVEAVYVYAKRNAGLFPLVIKAAYGGFGAGIHRFETESRLRESRVLLEKYLTHGGLVIEPWLQRRADVSSLVQIHRDGTISKVTVQMQRINRFGGFYGIEAPIDECFYARWHEELSEKTKKFAAEAVRSGYYGPFGCDSIITGTDESDEKLIFGIEINARFTMGMFADCVRRLTGVDNCSLMRIIRRKKCNVPSDYDLWREKSAKICYNKEKKEGVILLTPLRIGVNATQKQPQLNIFFLAGETRRRLNELDETLQLAVT